MCVAAHVGCVAAAAAEALRHGARCVRGLCAADNPLDRFYNNDYDYSAGPAAAPGDTSETADASSDDGYAPPPGAPATDEGADGVLEGAGEGTGEEEYDYSNIPPAPADYSITGYDYGFDYGPAEAPEYAAAYTPTQPLDYGEETPDLRDVLDGYLASSASTVDPDDLYLALALPITVDETILYGDIPFTLPPGNPWERSADAGTPAPPAIPLPEELRNITAAGGTGGELPTLDGGDLVG